MYTNSVKIKSQLEQFYDIPFSVEIKQEQGESQCIISPQNDMKELFDIIISYRQRVRMVIEIVPQSYSANMLYEMCNATLEKQRVFVGFVHLLEEKGAKVNININGLAKTAENIIWGEKWNNFSLRITRILDEYELKSEELVPQSITEWACMASGMMLALLEIIEEPVENRVYKEGKKSQVLSNRYERNPANRELCLQRYGYKCQTCGFDFEYMYGEIGYQFIHVHHIEKVSSHGGEYILDPVKDLIPVCPNCHAMLHRADPPLYPDDLREIISTQRRIIQNGKI